MHGRMRKRLCDTEHESFYNKNNVIHVQCSIFNCVCLRYLHSVPYEIRGVARTKLCVRKMGTLKLQPRQGVQGHAPPEFFLHRKGDFLPSEVSMDNLITDIFQPFQNYVYAAAFLRTGSYAPGNIERKSAVGCFNE